MGALSDWIGKIAGSAPTDWTLIEDLPDPGLSLSGKTIVTDECYIELFVESLRLEKARKFSTRFHGVVYSFIRLAQSGAETAELAAVTKPQKLAELDPRNIERVITVSRQMMGSVPWRGGVFGLELGLFSVKSGNLLTPVLDYVTRVSEQGGISFIAQVKPFLPLITEGMNLIAGQKDDTELELAIDTDINLARSQLSAIVALPKGTVQASSLSLDPEDRKLLLNGEPLDAAYCVFSIRKSDQKSDWGEIPDISSAFQDLKAAIRSNKRQLAEEALAGFTRTVITSSDLITADQQKLIEEATKMQRRAFPGGAQSADTSLNGKVLDAVELVDLNIYDK